MKPGSRPPAPGALDPGGEGLSEGSEEAKLLELPEPEPCVEPGLTAAPWRQTTEPEPGAEPGTDAGAGRAGPSGEIADVPLDFALELGAQPTDVVIVSQHMQPKELLEAVRGRSEAAAPTEALELSADGLGVKQVSFVDLQPVDVEVRVGRGPRGGSFAVLANSSRSDVVRFFQLIKAVLALLAQEHHGFACCLAPTPAAVAGATITCFTPEDEEVFADENERMRSLLAQLRHACPQRCASVAVALAEAAELSPDCRAILARALAQRAAAVNEALSMSLEVQFPMAVMVEAVCTSEEATRALAAQLLPLLSTAVVGHAAGRFRIVRDKLIHAIEGLCEVLKKPAALT